jgi:hypothetical protein
MTKVELYGRIIYKIYKIVSILSHKNSSFKYSKILNLITHVRQPHNTSRNSKFFWNNICGCKTYSKAPGGCSEGFFRWKTEYGKHSKDIGNLIYEGWKKGSTLYASVEYIDGELQYHEPKDPDIPKFGSAQLHLIKGYPTRWQLYKTVRAESVDICNKIKAIIDCYENIVLSQIDNDIHTPSGNYKLQRKAHEEVFNAHGYYPTKLDTNGLYLYPRVLAELFVETNNRNNNKNERQLSLSSFANVWDLRFVEPESYTTIGLGNKEMMEELKGRVERLSEDPAIRQLVKDYHSKKAELQTRENADQLEDEIRHMWTKINSHNAFLKGEGCCENLAECRRNPRKTPEGIEYVS